MAETKANEKKHPGEVTQETRDVADLIAEKMNNNGDGTFEDQGAYEALLEKRGLDLKTVRKVQGINNEFVAGAQLAVGEQGIEEMQKDPNLDRVQGEFKLGYDKVAVMTDRETPRPGKDGEQEKVLGVSQAQYTVAAASGSRKAVSQVRHHIKEMANEQLGQ